ncbi:MAG: SRPBCC family protein [Leptothrix sp. (in: b-proteobacteria)]
MQLEQGFTLPLPPAQAWPAFRDISLLVGCLPGASLTGPVEVTADGASVPLRFDVKLGPIAAGFLGSGQATFDDAARAGRFDGAAADRKTQSRVKGSAAFALAPNEAGGTAVAVTVDFALSGALAQFGRAGLVREIAHALTEQFAANLGERLAQAGALEAPQAHALSRSGGPTVSLPAAAIDAAAGFAPSTEAPVVPVVPLAGGALLARVLRGWWRQQRAALWLKLPDGIHRVLHRVRRLGRGT